MPKYSLERIEEINGKCQFFRLLKDGTSSFEEFIKDLDVIYSGEVNDLYFLMQKVADLVRLPSKKFRIIENIPKAKAFEFKTSNLRVYGIHEDNTGKIIMLGGKKNSQSKDIRQLRSLILDYIKNK